MFLQEQLQAVVAAVVILVLLWLLRRRIGSLLLWWLKRSLDQSKQYITKVIEKSVHDFMDRAVLTLIVYIVAIFFVQNERLATIVSNIAATVFVYLLIRFAIELTNSITATSHRFQNLTRIEVDRTVMPLVRVVSKGLVYIVGLIAIAQAWSIDVTTVFAGLGIGGLAVSLAAQDSLRNLIGFINIVHDKPFVLEEYISTPTAEGIVEDISLRSVRVRSLDQSLIVVPNSTIANEPVTNWSRLEKRRFNFVVGLPFTTPASQIEAFTTEVREMLQNREVVEPDSALTLFVEYDSSALNILIRCYVMLPNKVDALKERMLINLEINRIIDQLGLHLAVPARYLTIEQVQQLALPEDQAPQSGQPDAEVWLTGDAEESNDDED